MNEIEVRRVLRHAAELFDHEDLDDYYRGDTWNAGINYGVVNLAAALLPDEWTIEAVEAKVRGLSRIAAGLPEVEPPS